MKLMDTFLCFSSLVCLEYLVCNVDVSPLVLCAATLNLWRWKRNRRRTAHRWWWPASPWRWLVGGVRSWNRSPRPAGWAHRRRWTWRSPAGWRTGRVSCWWDCWWGSLEANRVISLEWSWKMQCVQQTACYIPAKRATRMMVYPTKVPETSIIVSSSVSPKLL